MMEKEEKEEKEDMEEKKEGKEPTGSGAQQNNGGVNHSGLSGNHYQTST